MTSDIDASEFVKEAITFHGITDVSLSLSHLGAGPVSLYAQYQSYDRKN